MTQCWAIKITGSPFDNQWQGLAGCLLFDPEMQPPRTKLFFTRKAAEQAIRDQRAKSQWAFRGRWASSGGNRIYTRWEAVRVNVEIAEAGEIA